MIEFENENIAIIEGMLFLAGDEGISVKEIKNVLNINEMIIRETLDLYKKKLNDDSSSGLQLVFLAGKYKLTTKPQYRAYYEKMVEQQETSLSQAAFETLAIIAYKQPVTRLQVEEIRGVSSDNVIRKLQAKALIKEVGRQDAPGKPILYGVTELFMDLFNLASIDELPPLEDLVEDVPENMSIFDIKYQEESIEL